VDPAFAQALELVQAQLPIAPHDPPAVLVSQGREEVGRAVEPIAQTSVSRPRAATAAFARVISLAAASAQRSAAGTARAQVVDAEQAARQHHRALVPQQLQPMRDGRQRDPSRITMAVNRARTGATSAA